MTRNLMAGAVMIVAAIAAVVSYIHIQHLALTTEPLVESATGGDGMRRRVIGATLIVLGVLVVLIEPFRFGRPCPDPDFINGGAGYCRDQGSFSLWGWVEYPQGWDRLARPMLIIGVALVVTGIVLLIKARQSKGSPSTAR